MTDDITLLNLNMLYLKYREKTDQERHVPLGPLYLVAVLEKNGYKVDFRDYQMDEGADRFDTENFLAFLANPAPIIGFSCMANLLPFTLLAAKKVKERYPDRTIILGGVGPFSVEAKILERFPWIDLIAYGEGEPMIVPLIRALQDNTSLEKVPGLFFKKPDGQIVKTQAPLRIQDPDSIDFPAFHKIALSQYEGYGLMTTRGCPYLCTFCSVAPIWGRNFTVRSNRSVIEEMRLIQAATGNDLFLFQDEYFLSSRERALSFSEELLRSGLKFRWKAFGRVNHTDRSSMEKMAEAGCIELRFGIESGSNKILERIKKGFKIEEAIAIISEAVQVFDRVDSFFIWGFPFETEADFYKTLFSMLSFRLMGSRILPSLFTFLPQTDIYNEYREKGAFQFYPRLLPEYMLTGHETICAGYMEVDPGYQWIFDFIGQHGDIFPGFFNLAVSTQILPKFRVLQEHGFYEPEKLSGVTSSDSCGAHSPKVESDSRQELLTRSKDQVVTHR